MKRHISILSAAFVTALTAVTGCLETNLYESEAVLDSDLRQIVAPAQPESEGETIAVTLNLKSNRSWSAELSPQSDWVSLSRKSRVNLSGISEEVPLTLEFEPYEVKDPRYTTLIVTIEGSKLSIPIVQSALVPELSVTTPLLYEDISSDGGEFVVKVKSNCEWLAAVKDGSTAEVSLDRTEGMKCDSVTVTIGENPDVNATRTATLILSTSGHDDIEVVFNQQKRKPYISIDGPLEYSVTCNGGTFTIDLASNTAWTAKVQEGATASATVSPAVGNRSAEINVEIAPNTDTASGKTATVVISAAECEDISVVFNQDKLIPFLTVDKSKLDTVIPVIGGDVAIPFTTNENWTASLKDISGSGIKLSADSGSWLNTDLSITFPVKLADQGASLDVNKATVVLKSSSGITEEVTFIQYGCLFQAFRKFSAFPETEGWTITTRYLYREESGTSNLIPRYDDGRKGKAVTVEAGTADNAGALGGATPYDAWTPEGYKYVLWAGPGLTAADGGVGLLYVDAQGLVIGSDKKDLSPTSPAYYIQTPAIEGKRLVRVQMMLGISDKDRGAKNQEIYATGTSAAVVSADGSSIVSGGGLQTVLSFSSKTNNPANFQEEYEKHGESLFDFKLEGTATGTSYRIVGTYRQVIRWWILYFE